DELREGVQSRFAFTPVVARDPVAGERLNRRELHALGCVGHGFSFWPPRGFDTPTQVGEICLRDADLKRTKGVLSRRARGLLASLSGGAGLSHDVLPPR